MRPEHVSEKALVEEHGAQRSGVIAYEHLEDPETWTARRPDATAHHFPDDGCRRARAQGRDGLKGAAVLVPDGKPIEQIFDRGQADPLQIRGASRTHPLEELERRLERKHKKAEGRRAES